jgi:hypothetical protein
MMDGTRVCDACLRKEETSAVACGVRDADKDVLVDQVVALKTIEAKEAVFKSAVETDTP